MDHLQTGQATFPLVMEQELARKGGGRYRFKMRRLTISADWVLVGIGRIDDAGKLLECDMPMPSPTAQSQANADARAFGPLIGVTVVDAARRGIEDLQSRKVAAPPVQPKATVENGAPD